MTASRTSWVMSRVQTSSKWAPIASRPFSTSGLVGGWSRSTVVSTASGSYQLVRVAKSRDSTAVVRAWTSGVLEMMVMTDLLAAQRFCMTAWSVDSGPGLDDEVDRGLHCHPDAGETGLAQQRGEDG